MPDKNTEKIENLDADAEKKRIKEERKQLKAEQKKQKQEAKKKAKELAKQEDDMEDDTDEKGSVPILLITAVIVLIWIAILALLVKLDVGGFGSSVLQPILKDVPVINKILPNTASSSEEQTQEDETYGYKDLKSAVEQIKILELELEKAQSANQDDTEEVDSLKAEVARLKTFEENQVEFQRIKNEFYEEVIYAEKGPGAEAYQKYYESIDPATAEVLYKQVVQQLETSQEITDYAQAYATMKPKAAAGIFESMDSDLDLAAKILETMDAESRGKILGAMDPKIAAKLSKLMEPDS